MRSDLSPRMLDATEAGTPLFLAGELLLSVLNRQLDSQADFQASGTSRNMDFTTEPGAARLSIIPGDIVIEQTADDADLELDVADGAKKHLRWAWQGFYLTTGRQLNSCSLKFNAPAAGIPADCWVYVISGLAHATGSDGSFFNAFTIHHSWFISIADGFSGVKTTTFANPPLLPAGQYWLWIVPRYNRSLILRYKSSDAYSGGVLRYQEFNFNDEYHSGYTAPDVMPVAGHVQLEADLYFSLSFSAYAASGAFASKVLDVGTVPPDVGVYQVAAGVPNGCRLRVDLFGSNNADMSSATEYADIQDGDEIGAFRYWRANVFFWANGDRDATPNLDMFEVLFANRSIRFRQKDFALRHADGQFLREYLPILKPADMNGTDLKPIERVGTVGNTSIMLESTDRDVIQDIAAEGPLKNYRCTLYYGADVPGFTRHDLARCFIGIVDNADLTPQYRNMHAGLTLPLKNPVTELKQKAPVSVTPGVINLGDISISYNGAHVIDAILGVLRDHGRIPSRYINRASFLDAKPLLGYGSLTSSQLVVYRSNAAGLADTRIKSPEELTKILAPLLVIADGYLIVDESGRLAFARHRTTGAPDAVWADEELVRAGTDAVPIEAMGPMKLGYGDLLFNLCWMSHTWNGTGDDWTAFSAPIGAINSDSANDFGQGETVYLNLMDGKTKEASKWLGPEANYGGATIAAAIAQAMVARYGYPPVRMTGVVVPLSQFKLGVGSIVRIWSREFCKFPGRRGIALSESLLFMVTQAKYDRAKVRMVFDVIEMT